MKATFTWTNEWKTWKSFWLSLFDFSIHLYPWEPSSWYREEHDGFAVPVGVKTHSTRLAGNIIILGLGFGFVVIREWTK